MAQLSPPLSAEAYGDAFADVYDDWYPEADDSAVDFIVDLARGGSVLELGVGTGRLAVAIAARGIEVWGVDASQAMLKRLAAKPGAEVVPVRDDIARLALPDRAPLFTTVLLAFNTLFCLPSDEEQRQCLERAAAALDPEGAVVVEAFVPSTPVVWPHGQVDVARVDTDGVVLKVAMWSAEDQLVCGQHVAITAAGVRLRPWQLHPVTPDRLDELAASAGLSLETRYADWLGAPFARSSQQHVTVYRLDHSARQP